MPSLACPPRCPAESPRKAYAKLMRPADHPDFFRLPAPSGFSRESSIILDERGQFFHEGQRIEHPGLARAFARWIGRHPHNGRYILQNGYDFVYLAVLWVPRFAKAMSVGRKSWCFTLLSEEAIELSPESLHVDEAGRLWLAAPDEGMHVGLLPSALCQLASELIETDSGPVVRCGGSRLPIRVMNAEQCPPSAPRQKP